MYRAFGLNIQSCIALPELETTSGQPDVDIVFGDVPDFLDAPKTKGIRYEASAGKLLLKVNNVAKFLVLNGNKIFIEPLNNATDEDIRLFLLGSCFGALIHQRGLLALHGSAIEIENSAVIFTGLSEAGKSTLSAAFVQKGYKFISDDICVISSDKNDIPQIFSGFPQMKLWANSIEKLGDNPKNYSRIRRTLEKYNVTPNQYVTNPLPVKYIFELNSWNFPRFEIKNITGFDKFAIIKDNTYRARFLEGLEQLNAHFNISNSVAKYATIYKLHRPSSPFMLEELLGLVLQNIK
ncbi:MAG: hypothetical protein HY738_11185 [Bacteroidia bacterium]|nr:hypothetical protein [Bacteroidia bacterium]